MLSLSFLVVLELVTLVSVNSYDPGQEQIKRLETLRRTCQRYDDDLTYEYPVLFGTHIEPGAHYSNIRGKFFVCVPPKTSAQSWISLMKLVNYYDGLNISEEEAAALKKVNYSQAFLDSHKSIVVRHPLERVLSAYRYTLKDTTLMPDINKKAFEFWLNKRDDKYPPEADEEVVLNVSHQNETFMSFRQFVNFLTKCPQEEQECAVWTTEGAAYHWAPFWVTCSNLCNYKLDSVIHMSHAKEDKEFVFNLVGLNNSILLEHRNKSGKKHSSEKDIVKKYYSRLLKSEIYDLYLKYKLDHELFGFTPDEFIAMGRDEIKTASV